MRVYLEPVLGFSGSQLRVAKAETERAKLQAFLAKPPRVPWARGVGRNGESSRECGGVNCPAMGGYAREILLKKPNPEGARGKKEKRGGKDSERRVVRLEAVGNCEKKE